MKLVLIKQHSAEWDYMWDWIAKHPINEGLDEPSLALNENEGWQYMGSYKQGNKCIHTFRHRLHPKTNDVINLSVNSSDKMTDEQIHNEYRL